MRFNVFKFTMYVIITFQFACHIGNARYHPVYRVINM